MAGEPWTTPEEEAFLRSRMDEYKTYIPKKKYGPFWRIIKQAWFIKYPEIDRRFKGKQESDLTEDERKTLQEAIQTHVGQIKTWYRWHTSTNAWSQKNRAAEEEFFSPRTRALKPYELYSHMYRENFEDDLQAEYKARGAADSAQKLNIWREVVQRSYDEADEDVKSAVQNELEKRNKARQTANEEGRGPQQYLERGGTLTKTFRAIQSCPAVLGRFLDILADKTGWSFSVLMGGPHPENDGEIEVANYHVGTNNLGSMFPQVHQNFDKSIMEPYAEFLKAVYPPSVCEARSLNYDIGDQDGESESQKDGHSKSKEGDGVKAPTVAQKALVSQCVDKAVVEGITGVSQPTILANRHESGMLTQREPPVMEGSTSSTAPTGAGSYAGNGVLSLASNAAQDSSYMGNSFLSSGSNALPDMPPQVTSSFTYEDLPDFSGVDWENMPLSFTDLLNEPFNFNLVPASSTHQRWNQQDYHLGLNWNQQPSQQLPSVPVPTIPVLPNTQGPMASQPPPLSLPESAPPLTFAQSPSLSPPFTTGQVPSPAPTIPVLPNNQGILASQPPPLSLPEPAPPLTFAQPSSLSPPFATSQVPSPLNSEVLSHPAPIWNQPRVPVATIPVLPNTLNSGGQLTSGGHIVTNSQPVPLPNAILTPADKVLSHLQPGPITDNGISPLPTTGHASTNPPPVSTTVNGSPPPTSAGQVLNQPVSIAGDGAHPLTSTSGALTNPQPVSSTGNDTPLPTSATQALAASPAAGQPKIVSSSSAGVEPTPLAATTNTHKSRRVPKPSNHAEKLNRIGTSQGSLLPTKENYAGSAASAGSANPDTPPEWASLAYEHLTIRDLGSEWASCVGSWWELEKALDYGGKGKGHSLAATKTRPEEWSKWILKTRHGRHLYNQTPTIVSATEFGIAVSKWWHDLQPEFRKTEGLYPADVFTPPDSDSPKDPWGPLWKGGPNGLVSILTVLVWWGQAALSPSEWEANSRAAWLAVITDVRRTLERLVLGVKRPGVASQKAAKQ